MPEKIKILISAAKIRSRIKELAEEISAFYGEEPFTVLALVNGAVFFAVDLFRHLKGNCIIDTIAAASYVGSSSTGKITLRGSCKFPVAGRNILLVDEVLDSGLTLSVLKDEFINQGAKSVRSVVLVSKIRPRPPKAQFLRAEWTGFELPDLFLIGMGMDYNEKYRELEDICVIEPDRKSAASVLASPGNIAVLGAGISGCAAAEFALSRGATQVTVYDDGTEEKLAGVKEKLSSKGIGLVCGDAMRKLSSLGNCDTVIFSPGVALDSKLGKMAQASGAHLLGELGFAAQFCNRPVYAVTGTNGKTTTTELLTACLNAAGIRAASAGNIGTPLSRLLLNGLNDIDCIVTEVSSFQMEHPQGFTPTMAILLNVTADHLNRHGSMENYRNAKLQCLRQLIKGGSAICDASLRDFVALPENCRRTLIWDRILPAAKAGDLLIAEDGIYEFSKDQIPVALVPATALQLRGLHNFQNIAAVVGCMNALNIPFEKYRQALGNFRSGPHRIEWIGDCNGIHFYDDSKATDEDAVVKALETLGEKNTKKIHLIAGGLDKGCSLTVIKNHLSVYVKDVALIGACRQRLFDEWSPILPCHLRENMADAVQAAMQTALPGDIILLSPGCASMDMFTDYHDRGLAFQQAVKAMQNPENN